MMPNLSRPADLLSVLQSYYFDRGKFLAYWTYGVNTAIFTIGLVWSALGAAKSWHPAIALPIVLLALYLKNRSRRNRAIAEQLKRHLEFVDGLAVEINADLLAGLRAGIKPQVLLGKDLSRNQFASQRPQGPARLLENTAESAWWSSKLAKASGCIVGVVFWLAMLAFCYVLYSLVRSILEAPDPASVQSAVSMVGAIGALLLTAVIFLVTQGLHSASKEYKAFAAAARCAFENCCANIGTPSTNPTRAVIIVAEYQTQRNSSPSLPGLVCWLMRTRLNREWSAEKDALN